MSPTGHKCTFSDLVQIGVVVLHRYTGTLLIPLSGRQLNIENTQDNMNTIQGDLHDPLTATYQTLELSRLNESLKQCGIVDVKLRRKICETFFFESGYFLDSGWFLDQELRVRPGVYFAQLDDRNQETGQVFLPDPEMGTMFHEYAHGAAAWLFEGKGEDVSEIQTGDINLD